MRVNLPPPRPPLESQNCFSPISADWFIRRITKALESDIHLNFTIAILFMTAKKALAVCRAHRGLPVGFLLLRYSV